jgi:hypothetical protein
MLTHTSTGKKLQEDKSTTWPEKTKKIMFRLADWLKPATYSLK